MTPLCAACPPRKQEQQQHRGRRTPHSRSLVTATDANPLAPFPPGAERCSIPADSPLTKFNESALVDQSKGWRGCDDYVGWGKIIGKLAQQFPMLTVLNIDDFTSNIPAIFSEEYVNQITDGLRSGGW